MWICIIALWGSIYMLLRNQKVFHLRTTMLQEVSRLAEKDIENRRDYKWRYEAFEQVSYDQMMRQFWKPVSVRAFYKDTDFLL